MSPHTPIRVGIIGLNPGIHWGATAHVPALASLSDDYELVCVANTSLASAERAAKAFGLKHAFPNAQALVESPEVDLVVVAVKVPHHRELVTAALEAGKHVYCEWPLGNGQTDAAHAYLYDDANGATMLSIPLAHTLAGLAGTADAARERVRRTAGQRRGAQRGAHLCAACERHPRRNPAGAEL